MEHLSGPQLITKFVNAAIVFWSLLVVPLVIMIILVHTGHGEILSHDELSWRILYYNLLIAPLFFVTSSVLSWLQLKRKKYGRALLFACLPLLIIFVELIATDIALWLL